MSDDLLLTAPMAVARVVSMRPTRNMAGDANGSRPAAPAPTSSPPGPVKVHIPEARQRAHRRRLALGLGVIVLAGGVVAGFALSNRTGSRPRGAARAPGESGAVLGDPSSETVGRTVPAQWAPL